MELSEASFDELLDELGRRKQKALIIRPDGSGDDERAYRVATAGGMSIEVAEAYMFDFLKRRNPEFAQWFPQA